MKIHPDNRRQFTPTCVHTYSTSITMQYTAIYIYRGAQTRCHASICLQNAIVPTVIFCRNFHHTAIIFSRTLLGAFVRRLPQPLGLHQSSDSRPATLDFRAHLAQSTAQFMAQKKSQVVPLVLPTHQAQAHVTFTSLVHSKAMVGRQFESTSAVKTRFRWPSVPSLAQLAPTSGAMYLTNGASE